MPSENRNLVLTISSGQTDADEQELAELSEQLGAALQRESDANTIERARGGSAPAGAKGDPLTLAALAVMIAPKAVEGLLQVIQNWVSRHERASVTVKSGDKELTITGEPSAEQQRLAESFLAQLKQ